MDEFEKRYGKEPKMLGDIYKMTDKAMWHIRLQAYRAGMAHYAQNDLAGDERRRIVADIEAFRAKHMGYSLILNKLIATLLVNDLDGVGQERKRIVEILYEIDLKNSCDCYCFERAQDLIEKE